jgi:hypothetical protein
MPHFHPQEPSATAHRFAPAAPDEDFVFGACSPGWHSAAEHEDALADWIAFMNGRGIDRVCSLLSGGGSAVSTGNLDRYTSAFGPDAVLHAPTPDKRLVDETLLAEEVLPFLDAAAADRSRVVVHSLAGIGRTGQVLAAWLAYDRDYTADRALETVTDMGRHPTDPVRAGNATEGSLHELIASFV